MKQKETLPYEVSPSERLFRIKNSLQLQIQIAVLDPAQLPQGQGEQRRGRHRSRRFYLSDMDSVGQNPMLVITADRKRPARQTGSCLSDMDFN
ncbi:MAG: hypothetical protein IJL96_01800, partial [Clostridia bacterium]|nr:hypothetical protein [Clostridia bacterium]